MATSIVGERSWGGERDAEGHRTYRVVFLVLADASDGPANVLATAGLPLPGSFYTVLGDADLSAWFRNDATVKIHQEKEGDPSRYWSVEMMASTKPPPPNQQRCSDTKVEDPLLEPAKVNGEDVKYTEEVTHDRAGKPVINSAWEQINGPKVEFDFNRSSITIEQNVATPEQGYILPTQMKDHVNDAPMWGFPRRAVKLSASPWERRFYGSCFVYYNRRLHFDCATKVDPLTGERIGGFDRHITDEGTKALHGHWDRTTGNWTLDDISDTAGPPSRFNPAHFDRYKDRNGENAKVVLNGAGVPIDDKVMGAVEEASFETPIVITSTDHGLVTGDIVGITGVGGVPAANGYFYVIVPSQTGTGMSDSFELWRQTVDENGNTQLEAVAGDGNFTGGGLWVLLTEGTGPGRILVEKYEEANFALLGIPFVF